MKKLSFLFFALFSCAALADSQIWVKTDASPLGRPTQYTVAGTGTTVPSTAAVSGDCTMSTAGASVCTKTNGVTFATSATTDTTNANNITTGIMSATHGGSGAVTGALKANGSGTVTQAACADLSNAAASCATDATNATNITSGTLPVARIPSHVTCSGSAPAMTAGTGAGTSPTVPANTSGGDSCGQISITTGTTPATVSTIVTVTFATAWGASPWCVISPASLVTEGLSTGTQAFVSASNTTTFTLTSGGTGLTAATAYKWNYACGASS